MSNFTLSELRNSNVAYLNRMRKEIQLDPDYQRQGSIWSLEKKQLLVDSLLNGFDIPKIYLHEPSLPIEIDGRRVRYALIDGRQRLEAIWEFLDGKFGLAEDFVLIETGSTSKAGLKFAELEESDEQLVAFLLSTNLDVCLVRTDDLEMIEEMFSRLNEAVPLNAAEKRNGRGGALRPAVKTITEHQFFVECLPFGNSRYRHYDLALKFLFWEARGEPADVKKVNLDKFWESERENINHANALVGSASETLNLMSRVFAEKDRLLSSIGMISVYYLTFQSFARLQKPLPSRDDVLAFNEARKLGDFDSESRLSEQALDFIQFDRLAQTPNDAYALQFRVGVFASFLSTRP